MPKKQSTNPKKAAKKTTPKKTTPPPAPAPAPVVEPVVEPVVQETTSNVQQAPELFNYEQEFTTLRDQLT